MAGMEQTPQIKKEERRWLSTILDTLSALFRTGEPDAVKKDQYWDELLANFRQSVPVEAPEIGTWYATIESVEWDEKPLGDYAAFTFQLTREPRPAPSIQWGQVPFVNPALTMVDTMLRTVSTEPIYKLFFTFTRLLPPEANLEIFKEFAVKQGNNILDTPHTIP
jgi:hypothetical protein